jgi:hypothetical protein
VRLTGPWGGYDRIAQMESLVDLEIYIDSESETPSFGPVQSLMLACPFLYHIRLHLKRNYELVTCLGNLPLSVSLRSISVNFLTPVQVTDYPLDNSMNSALEKCIACMPSLTFSYRQLPRVERQTVALQFAVPLHSQDRVHILGESEDNWKVFLN